MEAPKDVKISDVRGLSKEEARAVIEYYVQSGLLGARVNKKFVAEKWSEVVFK